MDSVTLVNTCKDGVMCTYRIFVRMHGVMPIALVNICKDVVIPIALVNVYKDDVIHIVRMT